MQIQSLTCDGMRNRQLPRVQPQPLQTELFGPPAVERSLAVRGIANDWVGEMFEVATDLVPAAGERLGMDQRGARVLEARVARDREREAGEAAQGGARILHRGIGRCVVRAQGVVHVGMPRRPAAHHGEVFLVGFVLQKRLGQSACGRGVQAHHEDAAGAFVETVHGVDMLAELIAHGLDHEAGFACVQPGAVDQPAGGLVDRDHVFIAPDQVERGERAAGDVGGHRVW